MLQDVSSVYQIFTDEVLGSGQFGIVYAGERQREFGGRRGSALCCWGLNAPVSASKGKQLMSDSEALLGLSLKQGLLQRPTLEPDESLLVRSSSMRPGRAQPEERMRDRLPVGGA